MAWLRVCPLGSSRGDLGLLVVLTVKGDHSRRARCRDFDPGATRDEGGEGLNRAAPVMRLHDSDAPLRMAPGSGLPPMRSAQCVD